jgi:CheY-like chemotaxis protein
MAASAAERKQQLDALLDKLDARDATSNGRRDRRSMRATYRRGDVRIIVHHPGGSITDRRVLTRDLSAGGLSFLHAGYLHIGTRVDVNLRRHVGGGEDAVRGTAMHCEHIAGTWHAVGVKFDRRIFPKLYLDPESTPGLDLDARQPAGIAGRVLLLDDSELDRRLMAHHLRRTKVELTAVATLVEACAALAGQSHDNPFELAVVDLNLADAEARLEPAEVVRRVVETGVPKVASCTAETDSARIRAVREAGCCGILTKPYDSEQLLASFANWLGMGNSSDGRDTINSSLADQPEMRPLLVEFVEKAQKLGLAMAEAREKNDLERCRSVVLALRGSGGGYGFTVVSEAATDAITNLEASQDVTEAGVALDRLQDICRRLSAEPTDAGENEAELAAAA